MLKKSTFSIRVSYWKTMKTTEFSSYKSVQTNCKVDCIADSLIQEDAILSVSYRKNAVQ